jgi:hypothetical protein
MKPVNVLCLLLLMALAMPVWAKKKPAEPDNMFLPPVATINPRLIPGESATTGSDNDLSPATLTGVNIPTLKPSDPVTRLDKPLLQKPTESDTAGASLAQAELDSLWRATVERNPIIRFSLDKLATPADLGPKYSSRFLSRTLNTVITGGAVAAMMMPGGGAYRNMGLMAGGDALKNMINGKIAPRPGALSPTEQIQLAGLVDDLRARLIQNYWDYRSALASLHAASQATQEADKVMVQTTDPTLKASKTVQYYRCRVEETTWLEKAKQHHIQLSRLAGEDSVKKLKWFAPSQTASLSNGAQP